MKRPRNSHIESILILQAIHTTPFEQRHPLMRIRRVDTVVDDLSRDLGDIGKSEYRRIMIVDAVDYDPAFRIGTKLPAERDLDGLCPSIPAESMALGELWLTDKDMKGIFAGFEVGRQHSSGFLGIWGIAVRNDHGVDA